MKLKCHYRFSIKYVASRKRMSIIIILYDFPVLLSQNIYYTNFPLDKQLILRETVLLDVCVVANTMC